MNQETPKKPKKSWKVIVLFVFVCLVTLVALFYVEEDWRGKHDWEQFKREQEPKGIKFDYMAYVPAPVPDEQNFAMSPIWIARIKYSFQDDPKKAEAWYGDRVDDDDVSKFYGLTPVSPSALVGVNYEASNLPPAPGLPAHWTIAEKIDLKPWQTYYRKLEEKIPGAGISVSPQPQSPATDVLLALSKFDPAIEQLRKDSSLPESRFPIIYNVDNPAEILLPHLLAVKQCSQVLELRAIAELQSGQTDAAFDDVKLMLRLVDSIQTEPFIISHLVRMVMIQMAIQSIYEGLSEHQWSEAQLAEMDSELAKMNYPADYQRTVLSESAGQAKIFEWLEQKRSRGQALVDLLAPNGQKPDSKLKWVGRAIDVMPKGWFYQGDILMSKADEAWAFMPSGNATPIISPSSVLQASNAMMVAEGRTFGFLGRLLAPNLSAFSKRTAFAQESADLARVAIALERYHLKQGIYPDSLDALTPKFMQEIPTDIINGEPLNYHRTSNGSFVLYSVGWNEKDDGGTAIKGSFNGIDDRGDWVWRYPGK